MANFKSSKIQNLQKFGKVGKWPFFIEAGLK